ncbi:histidinol phosphate aminotransferase [Chryseobacterium sp. Leaf404]|uniref:histidinol-phosphate transaminase n=1 Tax=unclassified Chryseobacterium TaxID=2593645 RepID=UPI0006FA08E8|nr:MULTISPECIES: histidinol-phosphate transaminase [unclassified Chryseobacterium]KQT18614.1 histidinol phosphate aminotransferase [Chryseobacterium sp. Leaf404]
MKKFNINQFVRKNILELKPYVSFRDQNTFENPVFLDANESPFGDYNRYPDSTQRKLKQKLSELKNVSVNQVAVGNGSDELIDLITRIFCEPKKDSVLMMNPSFAMYGFYASINENKVVKLNLDENFEIIKDDFLSIVKDKSLKIFFLCSPNNPTGNSIEDIEFYLENFNGIVIVDEAYIEFSEKKSCRELLGKYPNLIVLQTFSKAWGMAGARVGIAYASEEIIKIINTVKSPYNLNSLSLNFVLKNIDKQNVLDFNIKNTLSERIRLEKSFEAVKCIKKVYKSDANFFLIEFDDAEKVYRKLLENEILTSKRDPQIPNCIRINVGSVEENYRLTDVLKNIES